MRVLLTGASGYVGGRLLSKLLEQGHFVYALVRNKQKHLPLSKFNNQVSFLEGNLLDRSSLPKLESLDAAYYLVHSMADNPKHFQEFEMRCAQNFLSWTRDTQIEQIIYLSGLHQGKTLSQHFQSRLNVEEALKTSSAHLTVVRASLIIGQESSSFKIICDLVNKLPIMIAPRWLNTRCQPIAISDVLYYLTHLLGCSPAFDKTFEIGGPNVQTFKELLLTYARLKKLKRWIWTVPLLTPRLSSYWLFLVTKVNFSLASSLIESLKVDSTVQNRGIDALIPHECLSCEEAIQQALQDR